MFLALDFSHLLFSPLSGNMPKNMRILSVRIVSMDMMLLFKWNRHIIVTEKYNLVFKKEI